MAKGADWAAKIAGAGVVKKNGGRMGITLVKGNHDEHNKEDFGATGEDG